ncbi:MAG: hypothetical protein RIS70_2498 [Planctomycetota bacterium]|jgi:catechol 2,3-dioxygenase-like lactoylglutathione lyase family enzyme
MKIAAVLETCLYTRDLLACHAFYAETLGLECVEFSPRRHAFFRLPQGMLLLFDPDSTLHGSLPPHGAEGPGHIAFAIAEGEMEEWMGHLQQKQIRVERLHTWPKGGRSIYFRDPAGNSVEITSPRIWGLAEVRPA